MRIHKKTGSANFWHLPQHFIRLSLRWHYPNQVLGRNFWFSLSLHHKLPIIEMNCSMIWKNSSGNSGFMIYLPRPSAGSASAAFPPAVSALGAFGLSGSKKECPFLRLRIAGTRCCPGDSWEAAEACLAACFLPDRLTVPSVLFCLDPWSEVSDPVSSFEIP